MTIFYRLGCNLYANITNECPCACRFCIRQQTNSVGDASTLWLEREPTLDEIKAAFDAVDVANINEIVFCGFGEPLMRADIVVEMCYYMKEKTGLPIRINTNGLVKLMHSDFDVTRLSCVNSISISLNAADAYEYHYIVRSIFGEDAFDSMLTFALEAKAVTQVAFSIVKEALPSERIEACRKLAAEMNIPLRERSTSDEI